MIRNLQTVYRQVARVPERMNHFADVKSFARRGLDCLQAFVQVGIRNTVARAALHLHDKDGLNRQIIRQPMFALAQPILSRRRQHRHFLIAGVGVDDDYPVLKQARLAHNLIRHRAGIYRRARAFDQFVKAFNRRRYADNHRQRIQPVVDAALDEFLHDGRRVIVILRAAMCLVDYQIQPRRFFLSRPLQRLPYRELPHVRLPR